MLWTASERQQAYDTAAPATALGIFIGDVPVPEVRPAPVRFLCYWPGADRWEGRDYAAYVDRSSA